MSNDKAPKKKPASKGQEPKDEKPPRWLYMVAPLTVPADEIHRYMMESIDDFERQHEEYARTHKAD